MTLITTSAPESIKFNLDGAGILDEEISPSHDHLFKAAEPTRRRNPSSTTTSTNGYTEYKRLHRVQTVTQSTQGRQSNHFQLVRIGWLVGLGCVVDSLENWNII